MLDKFRLPKFSYYLFASQRPVQIHVPGLDDGPFVFVANLMTHFSPRDVLVFSNCEEVRLLKNGDAFATQRVESNGNLLRAPLWFKDVLKDKMDGQRLKAEGLINGRVVTEHSVNASGVPRKLTLRVDQCGRNLAADGSDIVLIYAHIQDANGNDSPFMDCPITFTIVGEGRIVGDESIGANPVPAQLGVAAILVQSTPNPGTIKVRATAQGLLAAEIGFESQPLLQDVVTGRDVGLSSSQPD